MKSLSRRHAVALGLAGAAVLAAPVPALAADRTAELTGDALETKWTSPVHQGFVYTSSVSDNLESCTPVLFECDTTLIHVTEPGKLTFNLDGPAWELDAANGLDIDLHVYKSDAQGTQGALVGEGVTATATETVVSSRAKAGYFLVVADWYFGRGLYNGKATLVPAATTTPAPATGTTKRASVNKLSGKRLRAAKKLRAASKRG